MLTFRQKKQIKKTLTQLILITFSGLLLWSYINSKREVENYSSSIKLTGELENYFKRKFYKK